MNAPGNILYLLAASLLTDNAVNVSGVRFAYYPLPQMAAMLKAGKIAAAVLPEPFASQAEQSMGVTLLADLDQGATEAFPVQGCAVTRQWAVVPQRRQPQLHHIKPVKQILPELVLANRFDDIAVGGGNEPDIDPQLLRPAHAHEAAVLQKTQQLGLQRAAHVSDLIEENRSSVGLLHPSGFLFDGASEGPLFVAEQFAFEQGFGDGGAVDAHVAAVAPSAKTVQGAGHELLARAAFAKHQHACVGRSDGLDQLAKVSHLLRVTDNILQPASLAGARAQAGVFLKQTVALGATATAWSNSSGSKGLAR